MAKNSISAVLKMKGGPTMNNGRGSQCSGISMALYSCFSEPSPSCANPGEAARVSVHTSYKGKKAKS